MEAHENFDSPPQPMEALEERPGLPFDLSDATGLSPLGPEADLSEGEFDLPADGTMPQDPHESQDLPKSLWTPKQQRIVRAIARHCGKPASDDDSSSFRLVAIMAECDMPYGAVNTVLQRLVKMGHLVHHITDHGRKPSHYGATATGSQFLTEQLSVEFETDEAATTTEAAAAVAAITQESSEPPISPNQIPMVFERNRGRLTALARTILTGLRVDPLLADDIVNDAGVYAYERYVIRRAPISEVGLQCLLTVLVRDRTTDAVRKEALINEHTARERTSHNDGTDDHGSPLGEIKYRVEDAMRRSSSEPLLEDRAVQNVYTEQLLTLMALMFLAMTEGQRNMILDEYRKSRGDKVTVTAVAGTIKSQMSRGRQRALGVVATSLLPRTAKGASKGEIALTRKEATEILLAEGGHTGVNTRFRYTPEISAMRAMLKNILYPGDTA
jgi:predicted transcriptional regulator